MLTGDRAHFSAGVGGGRASRSVSMPERGAGAARRSALGSLPRASGITSMPDGARRPLHCGLYLGVQVEGELPLLVDHGGVRLGREGVCHVCMRAAGSRWQSWDCAGSLMEASNVCKG